MHEIELRYQIPAEQLEAVRGWMAGAGPGRPHAERLQAAYFDTPDRDLARAGFALRLRREGRRWVQTLKGAAPDGMSRLEHNVALGQGAAMPALRLDRHAGHPAGEALRALVQRLGGEQALQCLFRTDIRRQTRELQTASGDRVELALDQGRLLAGDGAADRRETAVCELEVELKSGRPQAVLELAREWSGRGLWLEQRTKALRGDLLARQQAHAAVEPAVLSPWPRGCGPWGALALLLRDALGPVLANASQIASAAWVPEHLHQLRVGLRQLRSGLRLLAQRPDGVLPRERLLALAGAAAALGRALSAGRDVDAQAAAPWRARLQALAAELGVGMDGGVPCAAGSATATATLPALLHGVLAQHLMLDLLALLGEALAHEGDAVADGAASPDRRKQAARDLRQDCAAALARWTRAVARRARAVDRLEAGARHELRKRIKRLRHAQAYAADLLRERPRATKRLAELQRALGELNDLELALGSARARLDHDGEARAAAFELGFLAQERQHRLAALDGPLDALARRLEAATR